MPNSVGYSRILAVEKPVVATGFGAILNSWQFIPMAGLWGLGDCGLKRKQRDK